MNKRILFPTDNGGIAIIIPAGSIEDCVKDVPQGKPFEIVDAADIPTARTFRDAWEQSGKTIAHNLDKCKAIAHDKRRAARAAEFAPLDVEATIPAKATQAETARQAVRDTYADMQAAIDAATDVDTLRAVLVAGTAL